MENVINELIRFIQGILTTFWTILTKPGSFEEIFLSKSKDDTTDKSGLISVYPFFTLASFLISLFLIHLGKIDVKRLKDFNSLVGEDLLKNFSIYDMVTSTLPVIFSVLIITILICKLFFFGKNLKEKYDKSRTWILYMFSFQMFLFSLSFIIGGTIDFFLNAFGLATLNYQGSQTGMVIVSILLIASWLLSLIWIFIIIYKNSKKSEDSFFNIRLKSFAIAILIQFLVPVVLIVLFKTTDRDDPIPFSSLPFEIKYKSIGDQYLISVDLNFIWNSKETAYLPKEDSLEFDLTTGAHYEHSYGIHKLAIEEWSDRNSEVMTLKPGEIYWMHLSGKIDTTSFSYFRRANGHREFILFSGNNNYLPGNLNSAVGKLYFNFQELHFTQTP